MRDLYIGIHNSINVSCVKGSFVNAKRQSNKKKKKKMVYSYLNT